MNIEKNIEKNIENFERVVRQHFAIMSKAGLEREALVVLARLMQVCLQNSAQKIPCNQPLEVLMRAITAIIEDDPDNGGYVAEKWNYVAGSLVAEFSKHRPAFAQAVNR